MSADGIWNIVLKTPMGDRPSVLTLESSGTQVTGTISEGGDMATLKDGAITGDALSWKADVTKPFAMTLAFSAKIEGDQISGEAKVGGFGSAPFSGSRAG